LIAELFSSKEDGRLKLFLVYRILKARHENTGLFRDGAYLPLEVGGAYKDHTIAFARKKDNVWAIALAPRFLSDLAGEGKFPWARRFGGIHI